MHKPADAKATLWCPMSRCLTSDGQAPEGLGDTEMKNPVPQPVYNRIQTQSGGEFGIPAASRCIADSCAFWRWQNQQGTHGYCGIAGKPEFM